MSSFAVPRGKVLSPRMWRDFVIEANDGIIATATLVAVTAALVITSYVGARIGHTHPARTVARAVAIGVSTLVLALLVGQSIG